LFTGYAYTVNPSKEESVTDESSARVLAEATERQLRSWWLNVSGEDATAVIPKAVEYGSGDFDIMGAAMLALRPDHWGETDAGERLKIAREMAIMFYILGKVGRAMSAYGEGRPPSDDTLADLTRYSMMVRHVRRFGVWV
jgi:hypothetical protein